jgi:hypothetical protein
MSGASGIAKFLELKETVGRTLPKVGRVAETAGETGENLLRAAEMKPNLATGGALEGSGHALDLKFGGGDGQIAVPSIYSMFGEDGEGAERLSALAAVKPDSVPSKISKVIEFGEPLQLGEALKRILPISDVISGRVKYNPNYITGFLRELDEHPTSPELRIANVLGTGGDYTLTVGTENNVALKLSPHQMMSRPIPDPEFDAPVLGHGTLGQRLFFYGQPIGNTADITPAHTLDVIGRIQARGYSAEDMSVETHHRNSQIALFGSAPNARALLIDQGCATPMYGRVYEAGHLVPHARQQTNLLAVRDIIRQNSLAGKTIREVEDVVRSDLNRGGFVPTLSENWTVFEVREALKPLIRRKN